MKKFMMISMIFLATLLVTPAWSHHPAEGIVSDEIWDMVDGLLTEADSPHLDINFEDIQSSMGSSTQVSSAVVPTDEVGDYVEAIDIAFDELSENNNGMESSIEIVSVTLPDEDNMSEIIIYETLGYSPSFAGNK